MYTEQELLNTSDINFSNIWNQSAGACATLTKMIRKTQEEAGKYFVDNKDELAQAFRKFAKAIQEDYEKESKHLHLIINVSNKRKKE